MTLELFQIPKRFRSWAEDAFKDDLDKVDVTAHYDETLTVEENQSEFRRLFPAYFLEDPASPLRPSAEDLQEAEEELQEQLSDAAEEEDIFHIVAKLKSVAIVGDTGAGKTALSYRVIDAIKEATGREVYVYRHPQPKLIAQVGYKTMLNLAEMETLQEIILWIDEPQLHISRYEKRANDALLQILSMARQRGITLIITTSDTRFITRGLESYMDAYMIKDLEPGLVKQGSIIKKILKANTFFDVDGFTCPVNEFVFHSRRFKEAAGRHRFLLPSYWSEEHSKPYRFKSATERPTQTAR